MNKRELVNSILEKTNHKNSIKDVNTILDAAFNSISEAVAKDDTVQLIGFGTFSKSQRNARTGRNPKTGETITIDARALPKFKPGKGFKDLVNK